MTGKCDVIPRKRELHSDPEADNSDQFLHPQHAHKRRRGQPNQKRLSPSKSYELESGPRLHHSEETLSKRLLSDDRNIWDIDAELLEETELEIDEHAPSPWYQDTDDDALSMHSAQAEACVTLQTARKKDDRTQGPELCFGMLRNSKITTSQDLSALVEPLPPTKRRKRTETMLSIVLQPCGNVYMAQTIAGNYVGLLESKTSKALLHAQDSFGLRYQAFIPDPVSEAKYNGQNSAKAIYINIYGREKFFDTAGKYLSDEELWLQPPVGGEKRIKYRNPQVLVDFEQESITRPIESSTLRLAKIEDEVSTLFDGAEDPIFPEAEPSPIVKTTLLNHQKEALHFMMHKERGNWSPSAYNELWKSETGSTCSRYIHNITKDVYEGQPPLARGGLLADAMGLGKSLSALALIVTSIDEARRFASPVDHSYRRNGNLKSKATLLVVTKSTLNTWEEQIDEHIYPGKLKICRYHNFQKERDPRILASFDIVLTTYDTVRNELFSKKTHGAKDSPLTHIEWFRVILDEAHLIRNQSTLQFRAVCALDAERRWCITGTPIQNKIQDFGSLLRFLRVYPFDIDNNFRSFLIKPLRDGHEDSLRNLRALIQSVCLRRNKKILPLPKKTDRIQETNWSTQDRELYVACKKDSARLIETAFRGSLTQKTYFGILQSILRLRLICNHGTDLLSVETKARLLRGLERSQAQERARLNRVSLRFLLDDPEVLPDAPSSPADSGIMDLDEPAKPSLGHKWLDDIGYSGQSTKVRVLIQNLQNAGYTTRGRPVKSIVFSYWTKMLDLIEVALNSEGIKFTRLDGSLNTQQRQQVLKVFRDDVTINVILMSIGTGNVGLNLTTASHVHLMEPQWNPMVEQQALDRVHRIGQESEVFTTRYIVKDSIEESILEFQKRKLAIADLSLSSAGTKSLQNRLEELRILFK